LPSSDWIELAEDRTRFWHLWNL